jgi:hypothetical protein
LRSFRSTNFPDIDEVVFATNDENRLRCASLMPDFVLSLLQPLNVMMVLEYKATSKDSRLDEYVVLAFRFQDVAVPFSECLIGLFSLCLLWTCVGGSSFFSGWWLLHGGG